VYVYVCVCVYVCVYVCVCVGWGLVAGEDIEEGEFIIEYQGEVVHRQKCFSIFFVTFLRNFTSFVTILRKFYQLSYVSCCVVWRMVVCCMVVLWYGMVWYGMVWYGMVWCDGVSCGVM